MNVTQTILALIDMRSFSNLWYWIALAVTWSSTAHWVLGVPYDMVLRARRKGGTAADDLVVMVRLNVIRLLYIGRESGLVLAMIVGFVLSSLAILGFFYWVEFAQAVFLIVFPLTIVGAMSLATARRLEALLLGGAATAELVVFRLTRHRFFVQLLGMMAITVTALWGMWQNLNLSVLR
ncbi:component of SufBCD complex [Phaeovulum sp.]|uniref:component of SufBCD complex n=1 Tax=Phaeovulum sp. TaxID=2934796 RepID=UPI0039E3AB2B